MKLNNWYPQPHVCATLMYALPLFYKLMHQNMALVLHFFNPLPTLTHLAMFNCSLWLTVPALSHLLNSVMPQIEKETLVIVHAFQKFDQLLFGKSNVTVHTDHKPLETIFNRPLNAAPRRLQSMMFTLQRYTFKVEYHKGSILLLADTLSRAPLPTSSHKSVHDEMVYRVEFEADTPDLSGFQDATFQDIRATAVTDLKLIEVQALIESGWPTRKISVPQLARPYWPVRDEIKVHNGLLFIFLCVHPFLSPPRYS